MTPSAAARLMLASDLLFQWSTARVQVLIDRGRANYRGVEKEVIDLNPQTPCFTENRL
jgi:hypothetical protein